MQLEIVKAKGLAHNSYFLSDHGEALVIDPRRDCSIYAELAARDCARIKYIFESHCNEDFIVGTCDLQRLTNAEIGHSKETPFQYGDHQLNDGDAFYVGDLKIEVLTTPGHTNDSLCFVVYERLHSDTPQFVFTGDTLLAGDVGRTDLLGNAATVGQSKKLRNSIFERLLPLGDHLVVYPAHGVGSVCGHNLGAREFSTIGYERHVNPLLGLDEENFVRYLTTQSLSRPPYFDRARDLNTTGPPPMPSSVREASVDEFEKRALNDEITVIDTREPGAFATSHIPGALSIWLDGMSFFPGWVLHADEPVMLVTERSDDAGVALTYLHRLGFDNIEGYLCRGISEWRNLGKPTARLKTCSVEQLKQSLDDSTVHLIDVRDQPEWQEGHIKGAQHLFFGDLKQQFERLPQDKPIALHCTWGGRATLAASILLCLGRTDVAVVLGAIKAWKSLGYPLQHG